MKNLNKFTSVMLAIGILMISFPSLAFAKVNIFACEPEWAALSKDIGGNFVKISTATNAHQDVHHIKAKPSLLSAMRRANLVFCSGASLEIGWLPILMKKAAGPNVQQGTDGWLMAADYVRKLGIPKKADRSMGDVHPDGNPHIHLDPRNIPIVAKVLAEKLSKIDPENAGTYKKNLESFLSNWRAASTRWDKERASFKGKNIVVGHNSWIYLSHWLGVNIIGSLEPKPGIPPTASHLEDLLKTIKGEDVKAIVIAPYENKDAAKWLSEKTGIAVVNLPFTVGGDDKSDNLIDMFDDTIGLLEGAL